MPTLPLLHLLAAQAELAAKVVTEAYEKNAYVGTIIILAVGLVGVFSLLTLSWRNRAEDAAVQATATSALHKANQDKLQAAHDAHLAAMAAQAVAADAERERARAQIFDMMGATTKALADVSNDLRNHTEASKELTRTIQALRGREG